MTMSFELSESLLLSSDFIGSLRHQHDLSLVSSFSDTGNAVFAPFVRSCSSGHSLIQWCLKNDIQLTDRHGQIKQTLNFNTTIRGFRITPDLKILACGYLDKCIYQIRFGCELFVYFKTALQPCDICPIGDDFVVAVIDSSDYNTTSRSKRMLIKYNDKGQEVGCAFQDRFAVHLFTKPRRLSVNTTNTAIAVVNYTSDSSSHLVLLNSDMELTYRYFGDGKVIPANRKYIPALVSTSGIHDVCFDSVDNIIIADGYNKRIVLLNKECDLLRVLVNDTLEPVSLCMNTDGEMWCSFFKKEGGVIKVYKFGSRLHSL